MTRHWGLQRFIRDDTANAVILFTAALIPILLAVGAAVDYGRALSVRERMAAAADAAGLAVGSWPDLTEGELRTKVQNFFEANYPPSTLGTVGKLDLAIVDQDIHIAVSGSVPTTFMKLANINTLDVGASTTISRKELFLELVLVLDTTGSMGWSGKMSTMQEAAKEMVRKLFRDKPTSNSLKIGVVPFSGAVNLGADKLNSGWIDKDAKSKIGWEDFKAGVNVLDLYKSITNRNWSNNWAGCVRERDGAFELTDDPPTSHSKRWAPYFAPDEPDIGFYVNDYLDDRMSGSGNYDKRQRDTNKYAAATINSTSRGPDYNCPERAITPMTKNSGQVISAIEDLRPKGNTVIPAGLLWGWRVISPGEPYTEGVAYGDEKWVKAIVLLTDGENDVSGGRNGHNESAYNAFGFAQSGHLGSTSGSETKEELDSKTAEVCGSIKSHGIYLYTIGFQVTDSATQGLLRSCATEPDMSYNSPSNAELANIFQDIALGLGELRIAK